MCTFGEGTVGLRFVVFGKQVSGCAEDAQAEQIELGAAVHGTLDEFQAVDVSFYWAVAPGLLKRSEEGSLIAAEMFCKTGQRTSDGGLASQRPSCSIPFSNNAAEFSCRGRNGGDLR